MCGSVFFLILALLYGCRRSMFGGGAALNKCALYMYVQCLGASALCPEVCTKIILSESLKKFSVSKADVKEMES